MVLLITRGQALLFCSKVQADQWQVRNHGDHLKVGPATNNFSFRVGERLRLWGSAGGSLKPQNNRLTDGSKELRSTLFPKSNGVQVELSCGNFTSTSSDYERDRKYPVLVRRRIFCDQTLSQPPTLSIDGACNPIADPLKPCRGPFPLTILGG